MYVQSERVKNQTTDMIEYRWWLAKQGKARQLIGCERLLGGTARRLVYMIYETSV